MLPHRKESQETRKTMKTNYYLNGRGVREVPDD